MFKKLLLVATLGFTLNAEAQNRLNDLYTLEPGNHYPQNMPKVQAWINTVLRPVFIRNLQFSDNARSAAKFLSFTLGGPANRLLLLPNTGGIRLVSGPGQIAAQYSQELLNYRPFDVSSFDYTHLSYFLLARDVLRITSDQMIANTLNYFVETDKSGKVKYDLLIDQMNKRLKVKMPYATDKNVHTLAAVLDKQFPKKIEEAIFMAYIQGKTDAETRAKMQQFYNITGFFREPVEARLDDMMYPKIQFRQTGLQTLEIPLTALTLPGLKDSLARFQVETAQATLNYHERKLEITFTGKLNHPANMVAPKMIDRDKKTDKIIWVKPSFPTKDASDFKEFKLVISETGVQLFGTTSEDYIYLLMELPWA